MTPIKISLTQQLEAVRFAETRQRALAGGQTVRPLRRPAEEQHDLVRLGAAARTLDWLRGSEDEIKAFLALPAESRQAVLQHGEALAQMCMQLVAAEARAKSGGPLR